MFIKITKENFNESIKNNEKILIDFWASWCGPCKMLGSVLEEIERENPDIIIGKINVDENPELAQAFNVSSIPTLILFKDQQALKKQVGFLDKEGLLQFVEI